MSLCDALVNVNTERPPVPPLSNTTWDPDEPEAGRVTLQMDMAQIINILFGMNLIWAIIVSVNVRGTLV